MSRVVCDKLTYLHFAASFAANIWYEGAEFARGMIRGTRVFATRKMMEQHKLYCKTRAIVLYDRTYQDLAHSTIPFTHGETDDRDD